MTKKREANAILSALGALGWPLLIGLAACSLFYAALLGGPLDLPVLRRYFTGHPVPYTEAAFFFVGLAALLLKFGNLVVQGLALPECPLTAAANPTPATADDVSPLLATLETASTRFQQSALGRRLRDALLHVQRHNSAARLDEELKYLADRDLERQHDSLALSRIVIWAIPMLGFLGTVMGIALALGNLDPTQLANDPATAMQGLLAGLYVAFDTTALALTLSLGLMFLQFLIERVEGELLGEVEQRTLAVLEGRFETSGTSRDPHVATIERMCYTVMRSAEGLVNRQAELWQTTFHETRDQWQQQIEATGQHLQQAVAGSLEQSLHRHASQLSALDGEATRKFDERWQAFHAQLEASTRALVAQQQALLGQAETMSEALRATGEVAQLERVLNANLQSLTDVKNFEETLMTLTAAIHLLSSRVHGGAETRRVDLRAANLGSERAA